MKLTKLITFFIATTALVGALFVTPQTVMANSVCTDEPVACVIMEIPYTWDYDCLCDIYGVCQTCQQTALVPRCTIPQAGGGSCYCCFNDGCYLNCDGGGGGGGGGGDTATDPTPTLPPGVTPTATPTPAPGTITAVARMVTTDTTCAAVSSSTTGISGTTFNFTASSANQPAAQVQSGNVPVTFSSQPVGSYNINYTLPSTEWTIGTPCIYLNGVLVGYGESATLTGGSTLEWRFGFTRGSPWVQVDGGDVYASAMLRSYVPAVVPRVFNRDGDGGYPGVVSYGGSYDFDSDWTTQGEAFVSTDNWLVNANQTRVNYYDYFYRKYGSPTVSTTDASFSNLLAVTQPTSSVTPYYVIGDMTTTGDWSVGNGESVIIIVNGNLTIGGDINITGSGFIAFIVNGTIRVSSTVGTTASSETPVVEGVYVAMKADQTGGFYTGQSTSALTPRFVGKGMFIADTFGLERDLEGYGVGNTGSAAELFIYNPRLLLTMPDEMKENSVTWQEVAP